MGKKVWGYVRVSMSIVLAVWSVSFALRGVLSVNAWWIAALGWSIVAYYRIRDEISG